MVWNAQLIEDVKSALPKLDADSDDICDHSAYLDYLNFYSYKPLLLLDEVSFHSGRIDVDGVELYAQLWRSRLDRGTVFICHGLFDHSGLYLNLIQELLKNHYSVVIFDFPAHGLSRGDKRLVKSFDEYGEIIKGVINHFSDKVNRPFYAIGQSTGSAALMNYSLTQHQEELTKLVLLSPLVRSTGWRSIALSHSLLNKFVNFVPRSFSVNSHDPQFSYFLQHKDPLQTHKVSAQWVGAMRQWDQSLSSLPQSDLSTLVLQGTEDTTVEWQYNIPVVQKHFNDLELEYIEGARHHLVNEADAWRNQVFDKILAFFDQ